MGRGKALSLDIKYQIKALLEQNCLTQREIAKIFKCSQSAIKNIYKNLKNNQPLCPKYSGIPRKTSRREDRKIISTVINDRRAPLHVIQTNLIDSGVLVSRSTVRRRLKDAKLVGRRPAKKFKLTPSMIA